MIDKYWDIANWRRADNGALLVSRLRGYSTSIASDGAMALLRLGYISADDFEESALQIALSPTHVRDLIDGLTRLEAGMVERSKVAGTASAGGWLVDISRTAPNSPSRAPLHLQPPLSPARCARIRRGRRASPGSPPRAP